MLRPEGRVGDHRAIPVGFRHKSLARAVPSFPRRDCLNGNSERPPREIASVKRYCERSVRSTC